ncbi:uncharacterized protein BT62DRAFT_542895 [Guyanagaster necrorhizus]|uniref:Uncharacterized protein n=1 Tax=Guyanagaster necrorhizus TaxID=856835 RepID=A0A9P7W2C2_9AGAR|nr:uncharacterized protein BT62DRAFT_542895 [Guyanagaster necrorhizus MCA 3950]KAG7450897.1 hypothetical protein BT62DRAFT_542895 [Guyanagaster necrorhizus MCA 3950]
MLMNRAPMLGRRYLLLLVFAFIQCSSVNGYYEACTGMTCDSSGPDIGLAMGLAFGLFALLASGVVFACWRQNRIRDFQRTYVRNAQAQAFAVNKCRRTIKQNLMLSIPTIHPRTTRPLMAGSLF